MTAIYGLMNKDASPVQEHQADHINQSLKHRAVGGLASVTSAGSVFAMLRQAAGAPLSPFETPELVFISDIFLFNRSYLCGMLGAGTEQLTDNAIAFHAYLKWGEKCVQHLDGEYVIAAWHKQARKLIIAADPMGARPVYYYEDARQFIFCSEIKGIAAARQTPNYFNEESLIEYHFRQSDPAQTFTRDIFALCGGNILLWQGSGARLEKYWQPGPTGKYTFKKDAEHFECLRHLLVSAIEKRLTEQGRTGIMLSGGLDSASIACLLSEALKKKNRPLYAFSSVLPAGHAGPEQDESAYISLVGRTCGNIIQINLDATGTGPADRAEQAFKTDECLPNTSFYIDRMLYAAAQQNNIQLMYSGFGGDFWLSSSGNGTIYETFRRHHWKDAWMLVRQAGISQHSSIAKILRQQVLSRTTLYSKLRKLLKAPAINWQHNSALHRHFVERFQPDFSAPGSSSGFMIQNISSGRIGRLLGILATRSAFYGMRPATPMLDKDICEFLADLPLRFFLYNGHKRGLIREAMDGIIPREIQWRTDKMPYSPAYNSKIIAARGQLLDLMQASATAFVRERYLSEDTITAHLGDIVPRSGFAPDHEIVALRLAQAGIILQVLPWLKKTGYFFE